MEPTGLIAIERIQQLLWKTRTLFYTPAQEPLEPSGQKQLIGKPTESVTRSQPFQPSLDQPTAETSSVEHPLQFKIPYVLSFMRTYSFDFQHLPSKFLSPILHDVQQLNTLNVTLYSSPYSKTTRERAPSTPPSLSPSSGYETFKRVPRPRYPICISYRGPRPFSINQRDRVMRQHYTLFLGAQLVWRERPSNELIKVTLRPTMNQLGMNSDTLTVAFLAEGGYNTIYLISGNNQGTGEPMEFILRIPLPIDPYYKLESDVATTELMRHFTSIPVPIVYAYDSSTANTLGLEWMLMERIKGKELGERWLDMDNDKHVKISCQVAQWVDEMSRLQTNQIGSVYLWWTHSELEFYIGPSVHSRFSENRRRSYSINRGPFSSIWDYYDAVLDIQRQELEDPVYKNARSQGGKLSFDNPTEEEYLQMNKEEQDEQDQKNLREYGPQARWSRRTAPSLDALQKAMPIFREGIEMPDLVTALLHWDISFNNLFVDDNDNLIALLDWEFMDFAQISSINPYPDFLRSQDIDEDYSNLESQDDEISPETWTWLMEKQVEIIQTRLRPVYQNRLKDLKSSLLDLYEEEETWAQELQSRVMDVPGYDRQIRGWVELVLDNAPDGFNRRHESLQ